MKVPCGALLTEGFLLYQRLQQHARDLRFLVMKQQVETAEKWRLWEKRWQRWNLPKLSIMSSVTGNSYQLSKLCKINPEPMYLAFWVPYLNHLEADFLNYLAVFSRFFSLVGNHKKTPHNLSQKESFLPGKGSYRFLVSALILSQQIAVTHDLSFPGNGSTCLSNTLNL